MIAAYCFLLSRQQDMDSHRLVGISVMAQASGDKEVKDQLDLWEDEAE